MRFVSEKKKEKPFISFYLLCAAVCCKNFIWLKMWNPQTGMSKDKTTTYINAMDEIFCRCVLFFSRVIFRFVKPLLYCLKEFDNDVAVNSWQYINNYFSCQCSLYTGRCRIIWLILYAFHWFSIFPFSLVVVWSRTRLMFNLAYFLHFSFGKIE